MHFNGMIFKIRGSNSIFVGQTTLFLSPSYTLGAMNKYELRYRTGCVIKSIVIIEIIYSWCYEQAQCPKVLVGPAL